MNELGSRLLAEFAVERREREARMTLEEREARKAKEDRELRERVDDRVDYDVATYSFPDEPTDEYAAMAKAAGIPDGDEHNDEAPQ